MKLFGQLYAKFSFPKSGYKSDQENASKLELNKRYAVAAVNMGQSHTDITLQGESGSFNSVNFEFMKQDSDGTWYHQDIFSDPEYNPYIKHNSYELSQYDNYKLRG